MMNQHGRDVLRRRQQSCVRKTHRDHKLTMRILILFVCLSPVFSFHVPAPVRLTTRLQAKYVPPPPPPPPPPPKELSQWESLVQQISKKVEELDLPDVDTQALEEKLSSLEQTFSQILDNLPSVDLPSFDLPSFDLPSVELPSLDALPDVLSKIDVEVLRSILQNDAVYNNYPATVGATALLSGVVINAVLNIGREPAPKIPYPRGRYDPATARAYFDRKPATVVARALTILVDSLRFGLKVLQDQKTGVSKEVEYQRGKELAELLTKLGPTFIKVGQSLSIRTDLLSPAYIRGLETLQDKVPSFDTETARKILEKEWGCRVEDVIESLPAEPVAAASLGQVYKAKLKGTGEEVAIKVQRPNIREQIALDMYLLREFAPIVKRIGNLNSDTVGTVDAWGLGFVDELDYLSEAKNAAYFQSCVEKSPLKDVVFAPEVIDDYSTGTVLVSEWIDGERLDRSNQKDTAALCSIAMNTYLSMLLDFGTLHCDPHPGNLLRTPDGRLCILDWGMVTRINSDLQLTLMEHMAHLTSADYEEIPKDLLLLGFIPKSKAGLIKDSGVVEVLADIYGQWTAGGGAAAINVNDVINSLQDLTAEKGNLFQIPPYFAYIAKSFSVLEGIGLSSDPKYSIINGCLPYVSQRLITDKERMGPALSTFIFGPNKAKSDRIIDYRRVEQLVEGFGEYATSASGALLGKEELSRAQQIEEAADQLLDIIFTEEESPVQEIILEQLAKIVASSSRSVFTAIREQSGRLPSGRTVLGTLLDPLGLFRTSPLVRMNDRDEAIVETTQKLIALAQRQAEKSNTDLFDLSSLSSQEMVELASILVRKIWTKRSGVLQTTNRFTRRLLDLVAENLEVGERDSRRLPPVPEPQVERRSLAPSESPLPLETPRLQAARTRLAELTAEEA